jgi:RimJ/RimL family protein N-acetyltransferase
MGWQFTHDVEEYASMATPLLAADPARHTISLTVIENARARRRPLEPPELYGWWTSPAGAPTGAVSHTPPFPLLLGVVPDEAIRPLVEELIAVRQPPGVNAATALAAQFAAVWTARSGQWAVLEQASRLYRLAGLSPPSPAPPGRARPATAADTELLVAWIDEFSRDAPGTRLDPRDIVAERLRHGGLTLWQDEQGTPVSLAGRTRAAAGVVRIGPVYTPPEQRRRGWAGAVTAAVSQAALDDRAREVVLFTDLANPTSNALYQRLGYRPVTDRLVLRFEK